MMAELLAMKAELQGGAQGETLRSEVQGTDESRAENKQTDITEG